MIRVAFVLLTLFTTLPSAAQMEEDMQNRVETLNGTIGAKFSRDAIGNAQNAMMGDGTLSTLNGAEDFGAQVSCGSDTQYLNVSGSFSSSGLSVTFEADTNLDGTLESTQTFNAIHGLCSNGYVQCASPSAFSGCTYYQWQAHPFTSVEMTTEGQVQSMYNCNCIHSSCDPNSSTRLDQHLQVAGSGMVTSFSKQNPYFAISDVTENAGEYEYYGRVATACAGSPDPSLNQYFENPHTMSGNATVEQSSNEYFGIVSNAAAADDNPVADQSCAIIRNVTLRETEQNDIFYVNSLSNAYTTSCGTGCTSIIIGQNSDNWVWSTDGCTYYGGYADIELLRPDLITNVQLIDYRWDDRFVIDINENIVQQSGGWSKYDPEPSSCEGGTSHEYHGGPIDVTSNFTSAGSKKINMNVAVGDGGEYWAEFRVYYSTSNTEKTIDIYGYGQGRNWLECDYDLVAGTVTCTGDGSNFLTHITDSVDYSAVCESGSADISNFYVTTTATSLWGSAVWGIKDTTVDRTDVWPTCANGLKGSFRIEDELCCSSDEEYYLMGGRRIDLGVSECLYENTVTDSCDILDLNECTLKNHNADGTPLVTNFSPTGATLTPQTQTFTQGACTMAITEDFFHQNFTYECPSAPPTYTIDTSHLEEPTFTASDITITTNSSDPVDGQMTMGIPDFPEDMGCAMQCRVIRTTARGEFNTSGTETQQRDTDQTTEVFTRQCENSACPVGDGETIIEPCGCLNQFAQVAAAMEVMKLAAKDMVCVE